MPVIAMTREMGSGGREVAQRVADKLGLTVVLHHLVEHDIAEHLHVRESAVHHLLEGGATLLDRRGNPRRRQSRQRADPRLGILCGSARRAACGARAGLRPDGSPRARGDAPHGQQ